MIMFALFSHSIWLDDPASVGEVEFLNWILQIQLFIYRRHFPNFPQKRSFKILKINSKIMITKANWESVPLEGEKNKFPIIYKQVSQNDIDTCPKHFSPRFFKNSSKEIEIRVYYEIQFKYGNIFSKRSGDIRRFQKI